MESEMKILIDDGMQVNVGTGIGKYTMYLYNSLRNALEKKNLVYLYQYNNSGMSKKRGRLNYLIHINSRGYRKMLVNYDVAHFTNYAIPVFRCKNVKYVVTIHDLASFKHPESLPYIYKIYSHFVIKYSIKHANIVFTVSDSVKNEIIKKWPMYSNKVFTAYPGLYDEFAVYDTEVQKEYENKMLKKLKTRKFFLFVGTIEKRKNLGIVIKAFLELKKQGNANEYQLVLAGRPGFGFDEYRNIIDSSEYSDDIITTGYISVTDCKKLYRDALAYVFPSKYEGFGSTQLECMVNHLPIILSKIPTNEEVSGEYGMFFSLDKQSELENHMKNMIAGKYDYEEKNRIADKVCGMFRWENLVNDYIEAYTK